VAQFEFKLTFHPFGSLWFGKKLNFSMSGFLSNSEKEGLKNKFQVIATGSHPVVPSRSSCDDRHAVKKLEPDDWEWQVRRCDRYVFLNSLYYYPNST
jgi:hypothetical protein